MKKRLFPKNTQHVIAIGNGWGVIREHAKDFYLIADNQPDAINAARELAQRLRSEMIIYYKNGNIRKRVNYGI